MRLGGEGWGRGEPGERGGRRGWGVREAMGAGVSRGGRGAPEQRRHLGARLREAEDVVDEEEHVLALDVAEVLGDGERGERDARARAGGLVHLAVHERGLRAALEVDHTGVHHLVVQVVALARALADAGEDGEAAVRLRDVVDQLHDHHRLPHPRAAEEADLAALGVGLDQIDHLDPRREHLLLDRLLGEDGRLLVDRVVLRRLDGAPLVDRLADHVHDAAERLVAHRDRNRPLHVLHPLAADEALGRVHRDRAHRVLAEVLRHLEHEPDVVVLDLERVEDRGQVVVELHVDDGADDLRHLARRRRHRPRAGMAQRRTRQRACRGAKHFGLGGVGAMFRNCGGARRVGWEEV